MRILIVDDDANAREMMQVSLEKLYDVEVAINGVMAVELLKKHSYDVIVCDLVMDVVDGFDVMTHMKKLNKTAIFILVTAFGTGDIAIKAIQEGAYEYISKPFKMKQLKEILKQIERRLAITRGDEVEPVKIKPQRSEMIAHSAVFLETLKNMARIAASDVPVLITGESGTGKEVIANGIHQHSGRHLGPFVGVNCTAIPSSLLESELFGYEKGAFTGATAMKKGYFEQAQRGTLFLDEIGELTLDLQVKLLRVLQEFQIRRLGGRSDINLDVRFIFATNVNLQEKVEKGEFRSDLYYRLKVSELRLPSLRERREDILPLANHFIAKHAPADIHGGIMLSKKAEKVLSGYDFPGNVRELENMMRSAIIQAKDTGVIMPEDLSIQTEAASERPAHLSKEVIESAIDKVGGRKNKAADVLGVSRATLYRLMEKYGIDK